MQSGSTGSPGCETKAWKRPQRGTFFFLNVFPPTRKAVFEPARRDRSRGTAG